MRKVTPKILLQPAFYELGSTLGSLCNSISRIVNTAGGISVDSKANLIGKKGANYVFFSGKRRNEKNLSSIAHMTPIPNDPIKNEKHTKSICKSIFLVSSCNWCQHQKKMPKRKPESENQLTRKSHKALVELADFSQVGSFFSLLRSTTS